MPVSRSDGLVRLSGIYDWTLLQSEDGSWLYWHTTVKEERATHLSPSQRTDAASMGIQGCRRSVSAVSIDCWPVGGNYFSLGTVSKAYQAINAHACYRAPPLVVPEAQSAGSGDVTLP